MDAILAILVDADDDLLFRVNKRSIEKKLLKVDDYNLVISNEPRDVYRDKKGLFYFAGESLTKTYLHTLKGKSAEKKYKAYVEKEKAMKAVPIDDETEVDIDVTFAQHAKGIARELEKAFKDISVQDVKKDYKEELIASFKQADEDLGHPFGK